MKLWWKARSSAKAESGYNVGTFLALPLKTAKNHSQDFFFLLSLFRLGTDVVTR